MTYSADTPIISKGSVTASQIDAWYSQRGPVIAPSYAPDGQYQPAPSLLGAYIIAECYRHAPHIVNHDLCAAQIAHECAFWQSRYARERNNPSGLGAINSDPDQAIWFDTPQAGIRATVAHLLTYAAGEGEWTADNPRYQAVKARGWIGVAPTLRGLNGRWAFPGTTYGQQIASGANDLVTFATTLPDEEPPMLHVAVAAGHVNTAGGNHEEIQTVRPLVTELTRQLRAAGFKVSQITPDTGLFPGDHNAVARAVMELDRRERVDLYWECHTEGTGNPANRGSFGVTPYWPRVNPTDRDKDAETISSILANRLEDATGLPVKLTNVIAPGVMAEYQTGVGNQGNGSRLGVFFNTADAKAHMTRCIYEYGAHTNASDLAIQRQPWFSERAARATVEAIAAFYGVPVEQPGGGGGGSQTWPYVPRSQPDPWRDSNPWTKEVWIPNLFLANIGEQGGFMPLGYVLGPADPETLPTGEVVMSQWFERGRLQLRENGQVTRALVGVELRDALRRIDELESRAA